MGMDRRDRTAMGAAMSKYYSIKDESKPETAWNFLVNRRIRATATQQMQSTKRAIKAAKRIEAMMKGKPS